MKQEELDQLSSMLQIAQSKKILHQIRLDTYKARVQEERRLIRSIANQFTFDEKRVANYLEAHALHAAAEASVMELEVREYEGQVAVYEKLITEAGKAVVMPLNLAQHKRLVVPGE
jgi:hypothetical protein